MPIVVHVSDGNDTEDEQQQQGDECPAPPLDPMRYPQDAETKRMNDLSMKMWKRLNAGYLVPTRKLESQSAADFKYNRKLVEQPDRSFFHKRDMFSEYVEAAARMGPGWINKKPSTNSTNKNAATAAPTTSASRASAKDR